MSKCPLCHTPVKDDFGLLECPGCQAQLIVHMDGHVEYKGSDSLPEELPQAEEAFTEFEPMREFDLDAPNSVPDAESAQAKTVVRRSSAEDLVPPGTQARMPEDDAYDVSNDITGSGARSFESTEEPEKEFLGAVFADDQVVPPEEPPLEPTVATGSEGRDDFGMAEDELAARQELLGDEVGAASVGEDDPPSSEEPSAEAPTELPLEANEDLFPDFMSDSPPPDQGSVYNSAPASSPNLSDVAAFGNSDLSGGREGPLRYNLFIEGIDTVDVREAFREAITDRKLMWDTDTILRSVRNGQVKIQNVAPTKAYILITRLRGMPVQIRWEQYAISQT